MMGANAGCVGTRGACGAVGATGTTGGVVELDNILRVFPGRAGGN